MESATIKETSPLSHLADTLSGSEIVKLGGEIKKRIRDGEDIANLTIGDFDSSIFRIPKQLEDFIVEAYRQGYTTYPPANGIQPLREAVAAFIKKFEGLDYSPDEVLITAGGRPLIYTTYRAIVDEGDQVVYQVPSWNNNHYTHMMGGEHVIIETTAEDNFMITADQLAPHIATATLVSLCSPSNPSGTTIRKEELEKICDLILDENKRREPGRKKLYLLYDQMYWTLTYGDTVHYNPVGLRPEMKEYTIFIDGISKAFASTGVRVGWALGPKKVLSKMQAINSHVGAWAPMAEQHAVAKFLTLSDEIVSYQNHFKARLQERLTRIYKGLQDLKREGYAVDACAPEAALYLSIRFGLKGKTTDKGEVLDSQEAVWRYILNRAKLGIVPFYAFGAPHDSEWYRLSVGTCKAEKIDEILCRLRAALKSLH